MESMKYYLWIDISLHLMLSWTWTRCCEGGHEGESTKFSQEWNERQETSCNVKDRHEEQTRLHIVHNWIV